MSLIKPVYAQICNKALDPTCSGNTNPQAFFGNLLQTGFSLLFIAAVILFLIFFFLGAFHFITSEGDAKKIESGRTSITYAFVGLILIFSIFAILKLIGIVTGIQGLETLSIPWPTL
jgi:hypothetical protein